MANTPQNAAQKAQDTKYSNQSKDGASSNLKGHENVSDVKKNTTANATQPKEANKASDDAERDGIKNDPQSKDSQRGREEEDSPRAVKK